MATDITIEELTNGALVDNDWTGTGVFDKLIAAVNKNIEGQFNKGRITGKDYATVYLGGIQAVLQQSMEFLLREKLTEAQTDATLADIALKETQTKMAVLSPLLTLHADMYTKKQLDAATELVTKQSSIEDIFNQVSTSAGMTTNIVVGE